MTKGVYKILNKWTLDPTDEDISATVKLDNEYDDLLASAAGLHKARENERLKALISVGEAIRRGYLTRLRIIYEAVDGKNRTQHLHVSSATMPDAIANVLGKSLRDPKSTVTSYLGVITSATVPRRRTVI